MYQPSYAVHPGEFIDELLETIGMKQAELAIRLGITTKHLSNLINGKASLTVETAYSLEKVFNDHPAKYWLKLQSNYDLVSKQLHLELQYQENKSEYDMWFNQFDYHSLVKMGYLTERDCRGTTSAKISNLLDFFGCTSIDSWNNLYCSDLPAACRISGSSTAKIGNTAAWLRTGQLLLNRESSEFPDYNKALFKNNLLKIRELTLDTSNGFSEIMRNLCAEAGVRLLFLREVPHSAICGAAYWINDSKTPCIQMSLRFKKNDHFWFTFYHEAAHILKEHKKTVYLDGDTVEANEIETEANKISGDILIPPVSYKAFLTRNRFYQSDIITFAKKINIHPGIVVGRLQHDQKIKWEWHNKLKETFQWAE